ncbi:carbamoyl phosphate synthase small subunit [Alkaliphilus serpentinus]|uniref:Carbamoyl phosphate synthase small chain n=1 Tax=Alkaliphilus serpentinus TaxID=1482731 RepID=A0A833M7J0_9FIRM|nr:carbamoyl phosphate synthase small subunit [Alkaliphilus serpentinus]KAB3530558.1 glutamine-hydrolyzing carbamoyl-phosphate synthase small subunit [Alkaliphilus serpentinus]
MKAALILENGMIFHGRAFGAIGETTGEVVFNTGMTGYQEVLTDPSYYGQIVTMTYPLIGNYGINLEDGESKSPKVKGFIVREKSDKPSHWRCEMDIDGYLKQQGIMAIEGIDTRALTKIIRNQGTLKGIITVDKLTSKEVQEKLKAIDNVNAVKEMTTKEIYSIDGTGKHVAIIDFGIKANILRALEKRNCKITVFPAFTSAKEILIHKPDGILLSNGPGDPKDLLEIKKTISDLMGKMPIFGICLGHQLLALTLGGDTERLKYGHRGCNHPVKDLINKRVYITSQNHGYVVRDEGLSKEAYVSHVNLNDNTIEGLQHKTLPIFSVQFHPEASPGPKETEYLFDKFIKLMEVEEGCQRIIV